MIDDIEALNYLLQIPNTVGGMISENLESCDLLGDAINIIADSSEYHSNNPDVILPNPVISITFSYSKPYHFNYEPTVEFKIVRVSADQDEEYELTIVDYDTNIFSVLDLSDDFEYDSTYLFKIKIIGENSSGEVVKYSDIFSVATSDSPPVGCTNPEAECNSLCLSAISPSAFRDNAENEEAAVSNVMVEFEAPATRETVPTLALLVEVMPFTVMFDTAASSFSALSLKADGDIALKHKELHSASGLVHPTGGESEVATEKISLYLTTSPEEFSPIIFILNK
jgi:hypothetical protein